MLFFVSDLYFKSKCICCWMMLSFMFSEFDFVVVSQSMCKDTIDGCCIGYFWNPKNNVCEKCMPGYIGLNCSYKCPFPFYGEKCMQRCNCSNETCDVSTGCRGLTTLPAFTTECMPGYTGPNCSNNCLFPFYGENCKERCNCSNDRCDVSAGCRDLTTLTALTTGRFLLLFIQIIGSLDILFLFANLALCIYDRKEQEKTTDFLPPSSNLPQQSSTYENIEHDFFLPQELYLHD
nr:multiple epidermal growth factor-like domains protein 11 [Crassostrea gigas]